MKRPLYRWLGIGALALFAAACAQSNSDINRVQPNVTKKADLLDGEWYFRNTVTWAPASTGFTFAGETGKLEKLVFEIREDALVGYRSYPFIPGSEGNIEETSRPSGVTAKYCQNGKCVGGHKFYGSPVVAYNIQSHFDIQRNYNPATGETGNVIQENTTDRPWNEREFFRVNWSESFLNRGTEMSWNSVQNPTGATDVNSFIQANEPGTDPYDWPVQEFEKSGDTEKLKYFDFTGRYYAKPQTMHYEGYGDIPLCWLSPRYDCTANEIRMRTSLARVDPKKVNDYEPLVYPNDLMTKFGYFRTERLTYNRKFGVTELGVIYLANRFNTWKETFEKDGDGNPDQTKPIAMSARTPKPIVYYTAPADRMGGVDTYMQYLSEGRILQKNWDVAFRRATAAAQGVSPDSVGQMLYLCPNPVPAVDPVDPSITYDAEHPCGAAGTAPKFGDLRYSFMYTIVDPTPNGLLGYGPSSPDPETGELISANANTYTGAVDSYAQYGLDMIDTLLGEKTIDTLISGDDVRAYFASLENKNYASVQRNLGKSQNQLVVFAEDQAPVRRNTESKGPFELPTPYMASKINAVRSAGGFAQATSDRASVAAKMLKQHPSLESMILDNPEMKNDVLGMLPASIAEKAAQDPNVEREALRNVMLNLPAFNRLEKDRIDHASRNNMYLAEFLDRPMFGAAQREARRRAARMIELASEGKSEYQARVIADDEVRRRLQRAVWRATSEHEMGHTFGLRHNFQASFDNINYFDEYWDVKKPFLTVTQAGAKVLPRTPNDLRAVSDASGSSAAILAQADTNPDKPFQSQFDYEYSSIMDYGGKMSADWNGIGKYDEAAILFAYSGGREPGYVEVFNQVRKSTLKFPGSDGQEVTLTGAGFDLPITNAQHKSQAIPQFQERFHYSTTPLRFGDGADMNSVINSGIERLRSGNRSLAKWSDVQKSHAAVNAVLNGKDAATLTATDLPANALVEVPYLFCTDDHVGYVLSCNRFDRGPDYFEMTRQWLEDYWNGYYFDHFRRDRFIFNDGRATNAAFSAFSDSSNVYKFWVRQFYQQNTNGNSQVLARYPVDANMQTTWSMAAFDGINNLLDVMSVPSPGYHAYVPAAQSGFACQDCWTVVDQGDEFRNLSKEGRDNAESYYKALGAIDFAHAPRGIGRSVYSRYDFRSGFGFWNRMVEVGHYNDQFAAMFAAVMPEVYFLDADDMSDARRYNVPYYLVFNKELSDVFASTWAYDEAFRRPITFKKPAVGDGPATLDIAFKRNITPETYVNWGVDSANLPLKYKTTRTRTEFTPSERAAPTNIQTTWTARIYSIYLGMALFNVNYDMDYAKANQVFKVGAGEAVPDALIPANYTAIYLDDPFQGVRYAALQLVGNTTDTPAVKMIKLANQQKTLMGQQAGTTREKVEAETLRNYIRDLDMMRGMYAVYGKAF